MGIKALFFLLVVVSGFLFSFMFGGYGDIYMVLFLMFSLFNLNFLLENICKVEGGDSSTEGLSSFMMFYEVLSNLFFSVGVFLGVKSLVMFYVFMKFNMFPFVIYLYFSDLMSFEYSSWGKVVVLSYVLLSKVWGVLVFMVSPMHVGSLLFFSGFSLMFLLVFSGSGLSEYFISLLLLDGVMTLVMLISGVDVILIFMYIIMNYFFQVVSYNSLGSKDDISILGLYCLFVLAGGPMHPLMFFKYLGFLYLVDVSLLFFFLFIVVYVQYFLMFLYLIKNKAISGNNMLFYLMIFMLISIVIIMYISWVFFTIHLMLSEVKFGVKELCIKSFLCSSKNMSKYVDDVMPVVYIELYPNQVKWIHTYIVSCYSYDQGMGESGMPLSLPLKPPVKVKYTKFSFIYKFVHGSKLSSTSALYSHVKGLAQKDKFINSDLTK